MENFEQEEKKGSDEPIINENNIRNIYELFSEKYNNSTFQLLGNKLTESKFNIFLNFWLSKIFIHILEYSNINEENIQISFVQNFQDMLSSLFSIFYEENVDENILNNKKYLFDILNKNLFEKIHSRFHISFQNRDKLINKTDRVQLVNIQENDNVTQYITNNLYKSKLVKNFIPDDKSSLSLLLKIKSLDFNYLQLFYKLETLEDLENIQPKDSINIDNSITDKYIENNELYEKLTTIISIITSTNLPDSPSNEITNLNTRKTTKIRKSFSRRRTPENISTENQETRLNPLQSDTPTNAVVDNLRQLNITSPPAGQSSVPPSVSNAQSQDPPSVSNVQSQDPPSVSNAQSSVPPSVSNAQLQDPPPSYENAEKL